jgi:hypothetical protein
MNSSWRLSECLLTTHFQEHVQTNLTHLRWYDMEAVGLAESESKAVVLSGAEPEVVEAMEAVAVAEVEHVHFLEVDLLAAA